MKFFFVALCFSILSLVDGQIISIPYNDQDGFPIIEAQIENETYSFLFDTGAAISVIDTKSFKNKTIVETKTVGDISKSKKEINLTQSSIEIDALYFKDLKVGYVDLGLFNDILCHHKIDGIIGRDIMNKYVIEINTDNKIINFYNKLKDLNIEDYQKIKLENASEPKISLKIGNQNRYALLDTGSNGKLVISDYKLEKFRAENEHITYLSKGSEVGLHGVVENLKKQYFFPSSSLKIDKEEFPDQQFVASDFDENNLGFGFLKQFNVILDLKGRKLFLQKGKKIRLKDLDYSFSFIPSYDSKLNNWVITKINAEVKKIKLGDVLIEINGEKLPTNLTHCDNQIKDFFAIHDQISNVTVIRNSEKMFIEFSNN